MEVLENMNSTWNNLGKFSNTGNTRPSSICNLKPTNPSAVVVRNVNKSYQNGQSVLDNFQMTVPNASIYGLLGASGCGKTTLLSSIVGLRKVDDGTILVFGKSPGSKNSGIPGRTVGYMPQDIAIPSIFTIKEALQYYGKICGMRSEEIENRTEFLIDFLDLPEPSQLIMNCSGGQQRRVSLSIAMLHQPRLLILDEPTVGIDAIIRESIWKHLREVVEYHKTTVIISTHYINEASSCDNVGIMRNGRLLVETSPDKLLSDHRTDFLEDVFLKLCKQDECHRAQITSFVETETLKKEWDKGIFVKGLRYTPKSDINSNLEYNSTTSTGKQSIRREFSRTFAVENNAGKISAVVWKNFLTLFRLPWYLLPLIILPPFQQALHILTVGHEPRNVPFGIVNYDLPNMADSLKFCQRHAPGCFVEYTSCQFINSFIPEDIRWMSFPSEEDALESVHRGEALGYIKIPGNFTHYILQRSTLKNFIDNETMDGTIITGRLDNSYILKAEFIKLKILNALLKFGMDISSQCGSDPREVQLPFQFNAIYGSVEASSMLEYTLPGSLALIIFFMPMASAFHLVLERKSGTADRNAVTGLQDIHTILGFLITQGVLMCFQLSLCFLVMNLFHVEMVGNPLLFLSLVLLEGVIGLGFGFLFGNLCNHEIEAALGMLGVYLPLLSSSGVTWPIQAMPDWMRFLVLLNPITRPVEALKSIMSKGWTLSYGTVQIGFVTAFAWIFITFTISALIARLKYK